MLAQVTAGRGGDRDAHQRHCPHCHAALAEYERLWAPLTELAAEKLSAPDSIVENALRRIRGAVEHLDYGVLESARLASPRGWWSSLRESLLSRCPVYGWR